MEVLLTIPDDLTKYIEYIPKEALPEVIIDILREEILGRLKEKTSQVFMPFDIEAFAQLLQTKQKQDTITEEVQSAQNITIQASVSDESDRLIEEKVTQIKYEEVKPIEFSNDNNDLGDLLDLLK